jgi:hypothetical protein
MFFHLSFDMLRPLDLTLCVHPFSYQYMLTLRTVIKFLA